MGQICSNLCKWLCPKARNESQRHDNHANYQPYYVENIDQRQLQSHYIDIFDHFQPIPDSNTEDLGSLASRIVVESSCGHVEDAKPKKKKEDPITIDYGNVLEKNVTTKVDYVSNVSREIVRELGPYSSTQRLLLVGEGDFSFSASLAVAFGTSALGIIATSLNSEAYLIKNYRKFLTNKARLETRGSMVIHGVDATNIVKHPVLGSMVFDCIIYNFPHCGKFGLSDSELRMHQKLVSGFLRNAKKMIREDGEIHVTSKSTAFFRRWDIPKLGSDQGLYLIQVVKFNRLMYPGYRTKYGFTGDKNFQCNPSNTYKFGLSST